MRTVMGVLLVVTAFPSIAHADPCEGKLPTKVGDKFSGTVRYIGDGDGFCVGKTDNPSQWIEVRFADFDAPELSTPEGKRAKAIAEAQFSGKAVECTVVRGRSGRTTTWDRVFAMCSVQARGIGDILRGAGAPTGGNGTPP